MNCQQEAQAPHLTQVVRNNLGVFLNMSSSGFSGDRCKWTPNQWGQGIEWKRGNRCNFRSNLLDFLKIPTNHYFPLLETAFTNWRVKQPYQTITYNPIPRFYDENVTRIFKVRNTNPNPTHLIFLFCLISFTAICRSML